MKNYALAKESRDCKHCHEKQSLSYYMEGAKNSDLYWCGKCYKLHHWNGKRVTKTQGEAYPQRPNKEGTGD